MDELQDKFKVAGKWFGNGLSLIVLLICFALFYLMGDILFDIVFGRPISLKGIMGIRSLIIFCIASIGGVIYLLKRKKKGSETRDDY